MKMRKIIGLAVIIMLCAALPAWAEDVLTLPADLVRIKDEAFFGNGNIAQVVLPDGIQQIDARAFAQSGLKEINLPSTIESIAADAFAGCNELTATVSADSYAHDYCRDNGITYVVDGAAPASDFAYTSDESGVTIAEYTGSASNVIVPPTIDGLPVTKIANFAFSGTKVRYVYLPEGITEIGHSAFYNCDLLVEVYLPTTMQTLGYYIFEDCAMLHSIAIPDGIETISEYFFSNCKALSYVTIPASVKTLGYYSFYNCTALQRISLPGVEMIDNGAFRSCQNLLEVNLSETLTTIDQQAFQGCTGLRSLLIPESVTAIDSSAFNSCPYLNALVYPGSYGESFCIAQGIPYTLIDA